MKPDSYRFSLTAAQIEKLLLSIGEKLGPTDIEYDYTKGGAAGVVSAASAVRNMWLKLNEMVTGEGLKDAINNAGDSHVLTDYYKSLLDRDTWKFVGSPADYLARDDIDTSQFTGGEVILVQSNRSGNPEFQFWKRTAVPGGDPVYGWAVIDNRGGQDVDVTFPIIGTNLLKKIPKSMFHMVEIRIHAYRPITGDWQSVDGKLGYKGDNVYFSLTNEVETARLVEYSFDQNTTDMLVNITTLAPDIKCYLSVIAGY
uniref:Uncharacterized protein n=1 Tax=Serratia phage Kevin TaxID=3161161 RepID=A0AAU8L019_9CAUD